MLATHLGPMPSGGRRSLQDPAAAAQDNSLGPKPTREAIRAGPGAPPVGKGGSAAAAGDPTAAAGAVGGAAGGNVEAGAVDSEAADDGKAKKSKSRAAKVRAQAAGTPCLCCRVHHVL